MLSKTLTISSSLFSLSLSFTVNLHILYKLKTSKLFVKPKNESILSDIYQDTLKEPFAIEEIAFCQESRLLCIAGASSHVIVFRFNKYESHSETTVSVHNYCNHVI